MTTISWDEVGQRFYENGVTKGVFYPQNAPGVAWNGLTSVKESSVDTADPLYIDGQKYGDLITLGDFKGTMQAFTYPKEFLPYDGVLQAEVGFALTAQTRMRFGLCFRTEINSDLGQSIGYKLHLLYNVLAIPAQRDYQTLSLDNDPIEFEWDISAIPEIIDNFRPTAHIVIDSRDIDEFLLLDLENLLYGTEETDPQLPSMQSLITFVLGWGRLIISVDGDGIWTASSPIPGVIEDLDAESFQITSDTAVYLDSETYEISSSEEEEIP